ncbi:hypothetical protein M1247_32150 [Mycobacterium sp. 21AC1]|uniref:hypothetical protein n=1 Tax=[Mycobacterium] appelbergii TaxID=2939269 RepID=UPI0029394764|nr:hypothetical protein [Mycobacterium sp. 21AC1]MDV3129596.1 hypothetical protein [Mycobacterium sp. 21AC1]
MPEEAPRRWRGVRVVTGGDLQISGLSITVDDEGQVSMGQPRVKIRTDMWPYWLEDAIDAAGVACQVADQIPGRMSLFDAAEADEDKHRIDREIDRLMIRELRATMRAITASAFAIDAFYATVKERCGPHPHDSLWRTKGTSRKKRITETLRYHMNIEPANVLGLKSCVAQVFTFRDQAVHMAAKFREPAGRLDIRSSVDWHFHIFRRENGVNAVHFTVMVMDYLVHIMEQSGEDLAKCKPLAVERMGWILHAYQQVDGLPAFQNINHPIAP